MAATTLQTQARHAYKAKEYENALALFDRAIGRAPSVQLYDNRAACNVKLGNLAAALKDAKNAIHLSREDATGYLRAGSVLAKMGKQKTALDIYAHGLKCVRHVGAGYEQLKKMHDMSQEECAPQNSVDPMTRLPRELALQVLEYLSFRERTKISRTSKGWLEFIRSEPNLWKDLNLLTQGSKKVPTRFITKAINAAKKKMTAATLHNLHDFDPVMSGLARHCRLERLTLAATGMRGMEFVRALEPATELRELRISKATEMGETVLRALMQQHQSRLEVLHAAYIPRLTSPSLWTPILSDMPRLRDLELTIGFYEPGLSEIFAALAAGVPSLERLTFHQHVGVGQVGPVTFDLSSCKKLTYLDLQVLMGVADEIDFPPGLKYLKLAMISGHARPNFFEQDSMQIADLPDLQEAHILVPGLQFDRFTSLFQLDSSEVGVGQKAAHLKALSLLRTSIPPDAELRIPHRLRSLEALSLRECLDLTDDRLENIVAQLPKLHDLDVRGSKITGASIKTIIQGSRNVKPGKLVKATAEADEEVKEVRVPIRKLTLDDCADVGRDAVDWARAMGTKVEYKMTSLERGSKKVRY